MTQNGHEKTPNNVLETQNDHKELQSNYKETHNDHKETHNNNEKRLNYFKSAPYIGKVVEPFDLLTVAFSGQIHQWEKRFKNTENERSCASDRIFYVQVV